MTKAIEVNVAERDGEFIAGIGESTTFLGWTNIQVPHHLKGGIVRGDLLAAPIRPGERSFVVLDLPVELG